MKINQLLNQEEGCTIEELLQEEEKLVVLCRGGSIPKLIEFICQRQTLQKLINYAIETPRNPNNHDQTYKFPYYAADVLASNAMILQALIEGGWTTEKEEEEEDTADKTEETTMSTEPNENSLVQSILKGNDEQQMVQSALNSQNSEDAKDNKVEKLVDTLDELDLDGDEDKGAEEKGAEEDKGTEEEKNEEETAKPTLTQVGLKESIKNAGAKTEDNQNDDDDDEVNTEDPSEDVNDAEEGDKPDEANDSTATKLAGVKLEEEAVEEPLPRKDYSLLDQVTSCLYEEEELLPILCGYFLKVMEQLLDK